jgi:catechol 2,3-dioxygenase-like lactoylglutathione lyase family enzyme
MRRVIAFPSLLAAESLLMVIPRLRRLTRCNLASAFVVVTTLAAGFRASAQPVADSPTSSSSLAHRPAVLDVTSVGLTVDDLDRSVAFFRDVLSFKLVSEVELAGDDVDRLHGVFGSRVRAATLQLGDERIELTEFLVPKGRPVPPDSRSNDRWFQHIAIITSDMEQAYAHLRRHKVRHASTGPQTLPEWNPNAGGIEAFYFHDPDGHVLEILQFPPGKGNPKWNAAAAHGSLFLGIDHTAIVVDDTERSLAFFRDALGFQIVGTSENHGPEQERLNHVFGARLRITSLRPPDSSGPAIEFLEYLAPAGGRDYPDDARANDLLHWQTTLVTPDLDAAMAALGASRELVSTSAVGMVHASLGFHRACIVRDPDGHALRLIER